jgi:type I restriction enzyme S subunit
MSVVDKSSAYPDTVQPGLPRLGKTPPGWTRSRMSELLYEERRPVELLNDATYDLVTVKRARGGVVKRETKRGADISVKTQFRVNEGDFLISKRQIVHGACGIVPPELDGATVSNEYSVLRSKGGIDLDYLKYLSHSVYFQQTCFHSSIGVHIEKMIFKLEKWLDWEFDLPPLDEQQQIARTLQLWDGAVSLTERLILNNQKQKTGLMAQLLGAGADESKSLPDGWKQVTLEEIGTFYSGLTYSPDDVVGEEGLLVLRSSNIQNDKIELLDNVYVKANAKVSTLTKVGDVLICVRNGSKNLIGKVAQIGPEHEGFAHGAFMSLFRPHDFGLAFQLFRTHRFKQLVKQNLGATINSINTGDMRKFSFAIPTGESAQKIARTLAVFDKTIEGLQGILVCLRNERLALNKCLLTGKRRVSTKKEAA